jgi:hypothetical protein
MRTSAPHYFVAAILISFVASPGESRGQAAASSGNVITIAGTGAEGCHLLSWRVGRCGMRSGTLIDWPQWQHFLPPTSGGVCRESASLLQKPLLRLAD